jgi:hypothetical protein
MFYVIEALAVKYKIDIASKSLPPPGEPPKGDKGQEEEYELTSLSPALPLRGREYQQVSPED